MSYAGPPAAPPPGWYADPTGAQRWWDGGQWGPAAPPQRSVEESGRSLALVAHLGFLGPGPLLPLILRQTEGKQNAYVKHHATEALNFQLTYLVLFLAGAVTFVASTISQHPMPGRPGQTPGWFVVVFVGLMLVGLANFVFAILGCVRASQERWWRYPVSIRFVRGARPRTRR